jgi:hypothetical protein
LYLPAIGQTGKSKLESVESGVTLRMETRVGSEGNHKFYLVLQTNDVYECANYQLENEVTIDGNKLVIRVKGVRYVEPCTMMMGPATALVNLTSLSKGTYKVRTIINRQVFKSALVIEDDYYDFSIKKEDPSLFRIYNGRLNVIPDSSIWGKCMYSDPYEKPVAEKFMKDLLAAGAAQTQLSAGNYGDFYLHYPGEALEKVINNKQYEFPFIYTYTGDSAILLEIMNAYKDRLKIILKTSTGQEFKNY